MNKALYDNATVTISVASSTPGEDPTVYTLDLPDGAYSLSELELAIADALPAAAMTAILQLIDSSDDTKPYYADSSGIIDAHIDFADALVKSKLQQSSLVRRLHVVEAAPAVRDKWDVALTIDEAVGFNSRYPEPKPGDEHKAVALTNNGAIVSLRIASPGSGFASTFTTGAIDIDYADPDDPGFGNEGVGNPQATVKLTVSGGAVSAVHVVNGGREFKVGQRLKAPTEAMDGHSGAAAEFIVESVHSFDFFMKPITLEPDLVSNRVRMMTCNSGVAIDFANSSLFTQFLGFSPTTTMTVNTKPPVATAVATSAARIDKTRAVTFHCPSLAAGTYSTTGRLGGSQLAMVPIEVGLGEVQSRETSVPIELPSDVAGATRHKLHFFLSNEDGDPLDTLGERFEAVMVLTYDA